MMLVVIFYQFKDTSNLIFSFFYNVSGIITTARFKFSENIVYKIMKSIASVISQFI
jgi:hypothetical protein